MFLKIIRGIAWFTFTFGAAVAVFGPAHMFYKGVTIFLMSTLILMSAHE